MILILQEPPAPFKLPDGRLVSVSSEEAAELAAGMLSPSLAGVDCLSIAETAAAAIFTHLDPAVRKVGSPLLQALVRLQPKQILHCSDCDSIQSRRCRSRVWRQSEMGETHNPNLSAGCGGCGGRVRRWQRSAWHRAPAVQGAAAAAAAVHDALHGQPARVHAGHDAAVRRLVRRRRPVKGVCLARTGLRFGP